jgi:hypothetical protein
MPRQSERERDRLRAALIRIAKNQLRDPVAYAQSVLAHSQRGPEGDEPDDRSSSSTTSAA